MSRNSPHNRIAAAFWLPVRTRRTMSDNLLVAAGGPSTQARGSMKSRIHQWT